MGRKTRAVKPRHNNSIPPSKPSPISFPLRYQDEANEENHLDSKDHGASENSGSHQHNHNNDGNVDGDDDVCVDDDVEEKDNDNGNDGNVDGNDDVCVDDDVKEEKDNNNVNNVEVPDSVEEVDRHAGGNHVAGPSGTRYCIVLDWLEGEFCIRCNRRSGQVLVCNENGCPVAIHEVCMNCEPKFDDMGKFYCPYCWYKRELARTKELRRKAMLAKQELSNFMCLRRDGGNEGKQKDETLNMKGASVSTMAGKVNCGDCENRLNDDDDAKEPIQHNHDETQGVESISKEKSDEECISRAQGFDVVGNGERTQEEDIENSSENGDNEIDEDQWQIRPSSSSHLGIMEGTLHVSTKETSDDAGVLEENKRKRGMEEPMLPNAVGTNMALISRDATSKVPAIESFEFVSPKLDIETLILHQKRVKQAAQKARPQEVDSPNNLSLQPSTSAKDMKMNLEGETTAKYSVQCQESTKHFKIPTVGSEKRRRLHWTAEEEDMLKVHTPGNVPCMECSDSLVLLRDCTVQWCLGMHVS
ncbi:hypothetical protein DITRI_Ditri11bG0051500 [Diplodiscus trichospermus]